MSSPAEEDIQEETKSPLLLHDAAPKTNPGLTEETKAQHPIGALEGNSDFTAEEDVRRCVEAILQLLRRQNPTRSHPFRPYWPLSLDRTTILAWVLTVVYVVLICLIPFHLRAERYFSTVFFFAAYALGGTMALCLPKREGLLHLEVMAALFVVLVALVLPITEA